MTETTQCEAESTLGGRSTEKTQKIRRGRIIVAVSFKRGNTSSFVQLGSSNTCHISVSFHSSTPLAQCQCGWSIEGLLFWLFHPLFTCPWNVLGPSSTRSLVCTIRYTAVPTPTTSPLICPAGIQPCTWNTAVRANENEHTNPNRTRQQNDKATVFIIINCIIRLKNIYKGRCTE